MLYVFRHFILNILIFFILNPHFPLSHWCYEDDMICLTEAEIFCQILAQKSEVAISQYTRNGIQITNKNS